MEVLATLLFAIAVLSLVAVLLGLLVLIGMEVHWTFRTWRGQGPDDPCI